MHKVILIGNVGKDPEVRTFDNESKVANFSVADNERAYKTKGGKEIPEHIEWFNCVARGSVANFVESYVKKGHKVYIEGKIRTRTYERQDGSKGEAKELIVSTLESLSPKNQQDGNQQQQNNAAKEDLPW